MTPIAPSILTSETWGSVAAGLNSRFNWASMAATFSFQPEERRRETDAQATAQAKGLPMKVGPCMNTPGFPLEIVWATSCVVKVAAIVMYPPVRALPMHMMSGVTPACSQANSFPVRPNPVAISSKMSSRLYRSHSCLASRRYCG